MAFHECHAGYTSLLSTRKDCLRDSAFLKSQVG